MEGSAPRLRTHARRLGVEPHIISPLVFQAVVDKDLGQLRRFLRVGANIDLADLDGRTPLHVCASKWDDLDVVRARAGDEGDFYTGLGRVVRARGLGHWPQGGTWRAPTPP